jgi:hypothetical protein
VQAEHLHLFDDIRTGDVVLESRVVPVDHQGHVLAALGVEQADPAGPERHHPMQ